jgi:YVTN family beta-propeller protein
MSPLQHKAPSIFHAAACLCVLLLAACSDGSSTEAPAPAVTEAPSTPEPTGPLLFVTNEIEGTVSVIDTGSRTVVRTIQVGKRPRGIRANRDGSKIFVALSGSPIGGPGVDESKLPPPERRYDGVGVIDVKSGVLEKILPSGTDPEQFALSADGRHLFIANEDAGETTVLDVNAGSIVKVIKVGGEPEGVDIGPDGSFVYVTAEADNRVFVIDTSSLSVVKTIDVGPRPRSTGFVPTAPIAYVSAENDGTVYVLDTKTHTLKSKLPIPGTNARPMGVVASPDGRFVYVTTGRGRTLVKVDVTTNRVVGTPLDVGERPWGVAISADGRTLYTANGQSNDVTFIDADSWSVSARVTVGDRPWGLVVLPS